MFYIFVPSLLSDTANFLRAVPSILEVAPPALPLTSETREQGSTFGGNSLSCCAANFILDYVLKNKLVENAKKQGDYFFKKLNKLKNEKKSVKEARGKGLMIGIELDMESKEVVELCLKKKLLVNKCTDSVIRFLPPLVISENEIDEAIGILEEVL